MNPQAKIMSNYGILNTIINEVHTILSVNSPRTMSSNELLLNLPSSLQVQLLLFQRDIGQTAPVDKQQVM